jgi:biopolymer transport protein ExbD
MPVIQVVPLIDIMLVLLIFFVVTTTFKKQTKNSLLKIMLPRASELNPVVESIPRTPIAVTADSEIFLAEQPVSLDNLTAAISEFRRRDPAARLELKADERAPLGTLVKIWDALSAAGLRINTDVPTRILLEKKPE